MSVAGNTTAVGAASDIGFHDYDKDYGLPRNPGKRSPVPEIIPNGSSAGKRPQVTFATQDGSDLDEKRPFFVKIDKEGVLVALRKLNDELRAVSYI